MSFVNELQIMADNWQWYDKLSDATSSMFIKRKSMAEDAVSLKIRVFDALILLFRSSMPFITTKIGWWKTTTYELWCTISKKEILTLTKLEPIMSKSSLNIFLELTQI